VAACLDREHCVALTAGIFPRRADQLSSFEPAPNYVAKHLNL